MYRCRIGSLFCIAVVLVEEILFYTIASISYAMYAEKQRALSPLYDIYIT